MIYPPVFATNRPNRNETVAEQINWLLRGAREQYTAPPDVAIATAYLNPGGFDLVAGELERVPHSRLLIGAEPNPQTSQPAYRKITDEELAKALEDHERWLAHQRDITGFTLEADESARRLVAWLEAKNSDGQPRVEVRRYAEGFLHGKAFITIHSHMPAVLAGSSNFTYAGLTLNAELNLGYPSGQHTHLVQEWFDEIWEASSPYPLADLYSARWDPHPPWLIFLRMLWELYGSTLAEDDDATIRTQLHLTGFQRDGVARMLRLLNNNGGVIVADEVGLGKTFMAGEVISRAATRHRQKVLIVAPAALKNGMWEPFLKAYDFSRRVDVLSYDELRLRWTEDRHGVRQELDEYALVVVDEAHNLRNPRAQRTEAVNALVGGANPKRLILLTATPVNNTLFDLHSLVSLFIRNDAAFVDRGIASVYGYIKRAQDMDPDALSHEHLFALLDEVAVRRTRRFVKRHYAGDTIPGSDGQEQTIKFPTPVLSRLDYRLDRAGQELLDAVVYALDGSDDTARYDKRVADPERLMLARYTPAAYRKEKSVELSYQVSNAGLLRSTLLKRMESSPAALAATLASLIQSHRMFLRGLGGGFVLRGRRLREWATADAEELDELLDALDDEHDFESVEDYHVDQLTRDVEDDLDLLSRLLELAEAVDYDPKADELLARLRQIAQEARSPSPEGVSGSDRRKVIVFSSFVATVEDAYSRLDSALASATEDDPLLDYQGRVAKPIYGSKTGVDQANRSRTLGHFAPKTVGVRMEDRFDLLFATDVLSEGVNLQQSGRIINYDLPWNPMRVVQRHGRIDRIGSHHTRVHLDCFFPAANLDRLLGLKARLERKLILADAAIGAGKVLPGVATGEGRVFSDDARTEIMRLHDGDISILETGGHHAALSGEEFRQRLREAIRQDREDHVTRLPFGSGSGFANPAVRHPGYVFCARVRDLCRFRFVPTNEHWDALLNDDGDPLVLDDTLTALAAADPGNEDRERNLGDAAYNRAFAAWATARDHVYDEWMRLTDPLNLQPDVPKAMRDASDLVFKHGEFLGPEVQGELLARLNTSPPERIKRKIRTVLRDDSLDRAKVEDVHRLALDFGLEPAPAPEPLPAIEKDEVRLVAWMAVSVPDVS